MDVELNGCSTDLIDWLRKSRAVGRIVIDEGWSLDRDVSILVGRWSWLDVRALVEEHGGGKSLLRISTHLRPTSFGVLSSIALAAALLGGAMAGLALRYAAGRRGARAAGGRRWSPSPRTGSRRPPPFSRRGVAAVTVGRGMTALKSGPARLPLLSPSLLRVYGLRTATVFVIALHGDRHRHLHAARGRHRAGHRRAQRLRR